MATTMHIAELPLFCTAAVFVAQVIPCGQKLCANTDARFTTLPTSLRILVSEVLGFRVVCLGGLLHLGGAVEAKGGREPGLARLESENGPEVVQ